MAGRLWHRAGVDKPSPTGGYGPAFMDAGKTPPTPPGGHAVRANGTTSAGQTGRQGEAEWEKTGNARISVGLDRVWFSILASRLLKRSSFTSTDALREELLQFIDYFNKTMAKPFKWTYAGKPLTV